jgi:hypothetical protein
VRRALAGTIVSTVLLSAVSVGAEDPSPPCELRVGAVVASNSGRLFDDRLASLKSQFDRLFPYSSYRLVKEEKRAVQWGARAGFDLPGGRFLLVIPREYKDGRVSLQLVLIDGTRALVDTALALRNQGTFLVGGPRHEEGVLIIAIAVRSAEEGE